MVEGMYILLRSCYHSSHEIPSLTWFILKTSWSKRLLPLWSLNFSPTLLDSRKKKSFEKPSLKIMTNFFLAWSLLWIHCVLSESEMLQSRSEARIRLALVFLGKTFTSWRFGWWIGNLLEMLPRKRSFLRCRRRLQINGISGIVGSCSRIPIVEFLKRPSTSWFPRHIPSGSFLSFLASSPRTRLKIQIDISMARNKSKSNWMAFEFWRSSSMMDRSRCFLEMGESWRIFLWSLQSLKKSRRKTHHFEERSSMVRSWVLHFKISWSRSIGSRMSRLTTQSSISLTSLIS